jgi:N,N'-diacetylchitobiose transport system permease protein
LVTPPDPPRERRAAGRRPLAGRIAPYVMIAPAILGMVFLLFYPVLRNLIISFQHYGLRELIMRSADWTGFDNYSAVLKDPEFREVVRRTVLFTAVNVALIMTISTLFALMLTRLGKKMRVLVMIGLVSAWATPVIAATTIYQWLFQSRYGVVNWFLVKLGFDFDGYTWFADAKSTMVVVVLLLVWMSVPFATLTIYAGLTTVPAELYESARMDGAGPVRTFWSVTFPILRPMFGLMTSLQIIWIFKSFTQIWAIAGENGPITEVRTLTVYAYQTGVATNNYGKAGAISTLTIVMLLIILAVYFRQLFRQEREAVR